MTTTQTIEINNVPLDRKTLLEQAFDGIMRLSETDRKQVLSEFAERHGWYIE